MSGQDSPVLCSSSIEEEGKLGSVELSCNRFHNPGLAVAAAGCQQWVGRKGGVWEHGEGCSSHTAQSRQGRKLKLIPQALCGKALKPHLALAHGRTPKMP